MTRQTWPFWQKELGRDDLQSGQSGKSEQQDGGRDRRWGFGCGLNSKREILLGVLDEGLDPVGMELPTMVVVVEQMGGGGQLEGGTSTSLGREVIWLVGMRPLQ